MQLQETNLQILEYLERFKYLSNSQLIKLGVASSQPSVARILQRFFKDKNKQEIKTPLINKLTFAVDPKKGKLENLYTLNKKGAMFLAQYRDVELSQINYIKGNSFMNKDYFHRTSQINYHINLYLDSIENNYEINFFYSYFDKLGSNNSNQNQMLESKTKLFYNDNTFYIPDGIYKITKQKDDGELQEYYYILEIHKGNDTKRALDTISKNIRCLIDGSVSKKYDYPYSHHVMVVFDDERARDNVLKRLDSIEGFDGIRGCFEFR